MKSVNRTSETLSRGSLLYPGPYITLYSTPPLVPTVTSLTISTALDSFASKFFIYDAKQQ